MSKGCLTITEDEFLSLPNKQQLLLVFKNQEETKRLVEGYRFWYKINTTLSATLAAGMIWLFKANMSAITLPFLASFVVLCL